MNWRATEKSLWPSSGLGDSLLGDQSVSVEKPHRGELTGFVAPFEIVCILHPLGVDGDTLGVTALWRVRLPRISTGR